ncbi:hypothetical protein [Streptomyces sp. NPDC020681]|uniref:hypothetical protein n=1 Tax=Streptomyces sp. NPDC020681 TaxID=3365083 RepID=UPI00379696FF
MTNGPETPAPQMWFRLPPGFHSLDAIDLDEFEHTAATALKPFLEGDPAIDRALTDTRALADLLRTMRQGESVHSSVGVHPDGEHGACVSFFSLSVVGIASRTAGLAVAQCALAQANSPLWNTNTGRLLELPGGLPAALVAGTLSAPPAELLGEAGVTSPRSEVFQARVTVPCPTGVHVAVAVLTSAAHRHAEAYTDILVGIAQTLSFSEPAQPATPPQRTSRILELFS